MFAKNYTKPKVMITETRTHKLRESDGRTLGEAQLTPDQIQQIFQGAQNIETAGNTNRKSKAAAALTKGRVNESVHLTESQIFLLIGKIVERQRRIDEGIMDTIKGVAGRTADWARTKGQNLTTKITADKLLQAWKRSGSPTDSDDVSKVMVGAGVPQETVTNLMKNFVQGPSSGTNTNVWQGADRSIPAIQRKQQGQSFAATPNASGQTPAQSDYSPQELEQMNQKISAMDDARLAQVAARTNLDPTVTAAVKAEIENRKGGQQPVSATQGQSPTQGNLPLRYYGAGNKSPTDFWGRKRPVQPTMQSQQRQAALAASNAATTPTTTTAPQTPAPQGTTYDPSKAAANRLAKGQAAQQQALKQMAATQKANSPISQQYSTIKAAAAAALAKPGFEQTTADKLAIKQAVANNIIQMPKNTTTTPTTKVAEGEFAGKYATGVAGQWRNKGPKANKPATIGDLVGEGEEKDTPLANETVAEGSSELARILHIAGIRK